MTAQQSPAQAPPLLTLTTPSPVPPSFRPILLPHLVVSLESLPFCRRFILLGSLLVRRSSDAAIPTLLLVASQPTYIHPPVCHAVPPDGRLAAGQRQDADRGVFLMNQPKNGAKSSLLDTNYRLKHNRPHSIVMVLPGVES